MAVKPEKRGISIHRRSCYRKIRHATEYAALKAMHSLEKRPAFDGQAMKVYECTFCDGWHVGHVQRRARKKGATET
jgi:hypothetical protein